MTSPPVDSLASQRIAVTGAAGFLGWHVRSYLHSRGLRDIVAIDRASMAEPELLNRSLAGCHAVIHLAGLNRAPEDEVLQVNLDVTRRLLGALEATAARPHIVFADSTHKSRDTAYGRSKVEAAKLLQRWAGDHGCKFADVVFPHLFGEGGRPFYNSGIATFCHQLAKGEEPVIIHDGELELVHAQRAAEVMVGAIESGASGELPVTGERMRVSEALSRLRRIAALYPSDVVPALATPFDLDLFNTFRYYLFPGSYPFRPPLRTDARGSLFEAVRTMHGGQAFVSTTHPGITRGNHYHRRKLERFVVLSGQARIRVRRLFHADIHEFPVSGDAPAWIDMPTLHTHDITNSGSGELVTMFWSHEIFDPGNPDTFAEAVQA